MMKKLEVAIAKDYLLYIDVLGLSQMANNPGYRGRTTMVKRLQLGQS